MERRQATEFERLETSFSVLEKQISFDAVRNQPEVQKNVEIIQVRELIEAAVGPTMARTLELQTVIGDLMETQ